MDGQSCLMRKEEALATALAVQPGVPASKTTAYFRDTSALRATLIASNVSELSCSGSNPLQIHVETVAWTLSSKNYDKPLANSIVADTRVLLQH
jgi:hypothetical protein